MGIIINHVLSSVFVDFCRFFFWGGSLSSFSYWTHDGFPWDWLVGIFAHMFMVFMYIGKYTVRPMDPMGICQIKNNEATNN